VSRLSNADLASVMGFLGEAGAVNGPDPFPRELLAALRQLVPSDTVGYSELDRVRKMDIGGKQDPEPGSDDGLPGVDVYWRLRHEHPICHYHEVTGDYRALKLSDFVSQRELRRREIYSDWFRPWDVEHEMTVGLEAPLWHTKVFLFNRDGRRDFDERDRSVLDFLRRHLARLYRAARDRRRADEALGVLEGTDRPVALLDRAGRIDFATSEARRLLQRYFGTAGVRLPDDVLAWREEASPGESLAISRGGGSLVVRAVGTALLLEEQRGNQLTAREREILDLVAEGKTNAEIAAALWISPGTVRRHLENAYAKLGVHTRTAAVARLRRTGAAH